MGADEAPRFRDAAVLARVTPPPRRGPGPDSDAAIADSARVRAIDFSPSTHGLVVYFGDSTYEWRLIDDLLAYGEHADHLGSARGQPGLFGRVRFRKALDEAERWFEAQRKNRETPAAKAAKAARAKAEAALFRAVGATVAGDAESNPPPPCGLCRVCVSARRTQTVIPFSSRHKSRACAKPSTLAPIRGVRADDACPQIEIVLAARQGHVGANVALLGAKAIGRKVRCEWANERRCFEATVAGFDQETHTHRLEYDDGDVEPSARLWREHVHLAVPEDQKADAERRREKNDEAGARVEERGGGEARGGNARGRRRRAIATRIVGPSKILMTTSARWTRRSRAGTESTLVRRARWTLERRRNARGVRIDPPSESTRREETTVREARIRERPTEEEWRPKKQPRPSVLVGGRGPPRHDRRAAWMRGKQSETTRKNRDERNTALSGQTTRDARRMLKSSHERPETLARDSFPRIIHTRHRHAVYLSVVVVVVPFSLFPFAHSLLTSPGTLLAISFAMCSAHASYPNSFGWMPSGAVTFYPNRRIC